METKTIFNEMAVIRNITAIKIVVMKKKHLTQIPKWNYRLKNDADQLGMVGMADDKVIMQDINGHLGFIHEMAMAKWLSPPNSSDYTEGLKILSRLPQIFGD